jgi:hypothetical protein
MRFTTNKQFLVLALLAFSLILVACGDDSPGRDQEEQEVAATSEETGTLAVVDSVSIEESNAHNYVVVNGNYPDACTKISNVEQVVEENSFNITLYTEAPADLMCAQMLSPFTVNILLEVGGNAPGDYTVNVNDSVSTTLTLGG